MQTILISVAVVAAIGVVSGLVLSIASAVMAVKVDEKVEALTQALPGANCGACGYSGCSGYAQALADGAKVLTLCAPGGAEVAQNLGEILGVDAGGVKATAAVMKCNGNCDNAITEYEYDGIPSCSMANQLAGGQQKCKYGCLGLGDCVGACDSQAIQICNGIAVVDKEKCVSCRKCVTACPKRLFEICETDEEKAVVYCSNKDKGGVTRKGCSVGCIGCMRCQRACEFDAIKVVDNLATVYADKCTHCKKCIEECPTNCIGNLLEN